MLSGNLDKKDGGFVIEGRTGIAGHTGGWAISGCEGTYRSYNPVYFPGCRPSVHLTSQDAVIIPQRSTNPRYILSEELTTLFFRLGIVEDVPHLLGGLREL